MFSRCPTCNAQQALTAQQLRETRGLVSCAVCGESYDALPALTESMDAPFSSVEQAVSPLIEKTNAGFGLVWGVGSVLMLMLLLGQLSFFQGADMLRYPPVYSAVVGVCRLVGCEAPAYRTLSAWSISHSDLQPQINRSYWLTAALTNQAELAQALPVLKFSLSDFKGQIVAERLFAPQQYTNSIIATANQTVAVRIPLLLTAPAGGFTLSPV